MKGIKFFEDRNLVLTEKLGIMIAKAIKDIDSDFYEGLVLEGYDEFKIVSHVLNIDLDDQFVHLIFIRAARYSKIWIFS